MLMYSSQAQILNLFSKKKEEKDFAEYFTIPNFCKFCFDEAALNLVWFLLFYVSHLAQSYIKKGWRRFATCAHLYS